MNRVRPKSAPAAKRPKIGRPEGPSDTGLRFMGALAVVGFLIGVAWPKLAGVKLIPEAPRDEFRVPVVASVEVQKAAPVAGASEETAKPGPSSESLEVSRAEITGCQNQRGKNEKSCGELDVDALLLPRILMLESCPERAGASGMLSLGLELDFQTHAVDKIRSGASTSLPDAVRDGLLKCARASFLSLKLPDEKAAHARYTVFYRVNFRLSGGEGATGETVAKATGEVVVRWPTALVRKSADRGSDVVVKVRAGAVLTVRGRSGDWLEVEASDGGKKKTGFIHGAAVGETH